MTLPQRTQSRWWWCSVEVLGKLETGELVAGRDAPNEARRLQIGEVSVGRAPGEIGEAVRDVADTHRVAGRPEQLDDGASAGRVPLLDEPQARLGDLVQGPLEVSRGHHAHPRWCA